MLRVNGAIQKSTDVMKAMQSLCKVPQIQETMRELSKEMMKVGVLFISHSRERQDDLKHAT